VTAPALSEDAFQKRITDLCDWLGLTWHHETDSRRSRAGFPDLVIAGKRVIFAELKTDRGRVRPEQQRWLDTLAAAGADAYVWRPADWPTIQATLKAIA
jgi:hypothetical protein